MGFPCLWDNFGGFAVWDPKLWIMATISSKRHVYQRNHYVWCIIYHRRKSRLTCRLHGENGRTETQKFDKRPPRGGATAQPTQQICTLIKCTPGLGHPCPIWFWSVDAFLFHRGSNSSNSWIEFPVFSMLSRTAHTTVLCITVQRCDDVVMGTCNAIHLRCFAPKIRPSYVDIIELNIGLCVHRPISYSVTLAIHENRLCSTITQRSTRRSDRSFNPMLGHRVLVLNIPTLVWHWR